MTKEEISTIILPYRVAYFEKNVWEAYYDRRWFHAFILLIRLNRQAFRLTRFVALAAALDSVRAALAFAPLTGNDIPGATRHLQRFYEKVRHSMKIETSASELARLEIDYWIVHRQLALQRQTTESDVAIDPLIDSLARLHTALFQGSVAAMRRSAEWRAQAAQTVDKITGQTSLDVAADWVRVEDALRMAYQIIRDDQRLDAIVADPISPGI